MSDERRARDATVESYRARIDRVLAHIERAVAEGGGELDLDALAEIACFSRFHFHRIYRAMTGETPAQTVRRLRLDRAAAALLDSDRPVAEIAREAGYGGVEAFTRAFAAAYRAGPAAFRAGAPQPVETILSKFIDNVEVKQTPAYRLAAIAHRGPYPKVGAAFEQLGAWAGAQGLMRPDAAFIGIYYDDPESTPEAELRADACVSVPDGFDPSAPAHLVEIAAGEHAVYRHVGPYSGLAEAWRGLYAEWLPQSGREPANAPAYELYVRMAGQGGAEESITELRLPLKPA